MGGDRNQSVSTLKNLTCHLPSPPALEPEALLQLASSALQDLKTPASLPPISQALQGDPTVPLGLPSTLPLLPVPIQVFPHLNSWIKPLALLPTSVLFALQPILASAGSLKPVMAKILSRAYLSDRRRLRFFSATFKSLHNGTPAFQT